MKKMITFLVLGLSLFVSAKPMPQRLGVGIKNNTTESVPGLAAVYNVNGDFAFLGGFGFDTKKDYSTMEVNAGVRHIIFHENQLHFYTAGQFAIVNYEAPVTGKKSGFETRLVLGTEFFFTGLDNVGFSFEGGLALTSVDSTRVLTVADSPLKAGMLFYF